MVLLSQPQLPRRELRMLMSRAEHQGHLTVQDILDVYPTGEDEFVRAFLLFFQKRGIEILDGDLGLQETDQEEIESDQELLANLEHISANDTIGLYLKEMARVPLLTVDQELDIARRVEKGRQVQAKLRRNGTALKAEQRAAYHEIVQDGLQARDHLIRANTRLVVSVAKKYMGRGLPLLDLIQEGNLGLMKAVEKYDYKRGFRFSTYATWWIRQTISRAVANQGRTIRVPVHMLDRIHTMYRTAHELEQKLGRPPENEELAEALEIGMERLLWLKRLSWTPVSLENPVGDEEDSELSMFIEDTQSPAPNQITQSKMLREKIEEVLATLSPREARILRMRYGLDNGHPYTLEEVGQKFGLSRERIRQIESKALRRLRHPCRARQLREYL